ncbi:MAG: alanine--tRNA ligase [Acidobacteriota bacterium]|jgi:alanyl-tRNA synthetase|nr:alanine--tRNA ligase [Acidobacteriota bacterium]
MNHLEIRQRFLAYFEANGHRRVLSAPLVPARDHTLLFTNAGMNQFKSVFLQQESREYNRAVSIQKCMRVSGKHNDFDEVGRTAFHHTFFEMLGNFSFGDYFKEKAIELAWTLLTRDYGFSPERLWVSVFREDDEAFRIWQERIGVPEERIARMDEADNFWQMGDTGPCGPCSEIHFDRGEAFGAADFVANPSRFVEIWNLVFMQFLRDESGRLSPLPAPSIDTGMGLERLAALLQGVAGNYQTDLFSPIIRAAAEMIDVDAAAAATRVPLNVIADHIRALTFLIADGVLPANDGRGYVLRRILRRAARHGRTLGREEPFLYRLCHSVVEIMTPCYPELEFSADFISRVIRNEEERFAHTLARGLKRFDELMEKARELKRPIIPGGELFTLSDTYGFPLDFAVDLAREKDVEIDQEGFQAALNRQRELSRARRRDAHAGPALDGVNAHVTRFTGYTLQEDTATVSAVYLDGKPVHSAKTTGGEKELILIFDRTPFYAESGGQVGDRGKGHTDNAFFRVTDTRKTGNGAFLHYATLLRGEIAVADRARLEIDTAHRRETAAHHTATHLLHSALREVLGLHVKQSGSYVGPDKLRFDFTHFQAMTREEIEAVEILVNAQIRRNIRINETTEEYDVAVSRGAIAFFEEKYSDIVRVIQVDDFSTELCGGTHLDATGEIGVFKILAESSISAGIRRIEALAGVPAFHHIQQRLQNLQVLQQHFSQPPEKLPEHLLQLEQHARELEKRLESLQRRRHHPDLKTLLEKAEPIDGTQAVVEFFGELDRSQLSAFADELKKQLKGLAVLFANVNGKSAITISVDSGLAASFNAAELVKEIAGLVGGSGGGRSDFAQAGGKPVVDFSLLRPKVIGILRKRSP